ncbi:MAG TPA: hypothetical protein VIL28_02470 [Steroidobacteraceae bacterium]
MPRTIRARVEDPLFVTISGGYDQQSASPIGRLFALSLRKTW